MLRLVFTFSLLAASASAQRLSIPVDPDQFRRSNEKLIAAAKTGDDATVLLEGRRTLELVPNEPTLQAPVYLLMSAAARHLGENARAQDYATAAKSLDPSLGVRLPTAEALPATRGSASDAIQQAVSIAGQSVGAYQQIKMMQLCLEMVKHNMTPPPQCGAQQPGQLPQQGFPQANALNPPPALQPGLQSGLQPGIQPGIQPAPPLNAPPGTMPPSLPPSTPPSAPQLAPAVNSFPPPLQASPNFAATPPLNQPPAMPLPPISLPSTPPVSYPTAPIGTAGYQPLSAPPAAAPGWPAQTAPAPAAQPYAAPNQPSYPAQQPAYAGQPQARAYQRPGGPGPYGNPGYPMRAGRTRGEEEPVYRVIHDHSLLASANYFDQSYGGLLSVSGTNLTFTSSSGEAPRVIPAAEILEIRLNSVIGRDAGGFHIATRRGLYLNLVPESLVREKARELIETLRSKLGLLE